MTSRFRTSYFVTDDEGARIIAQAEGIAVITTWDLLRAATKAGLLTVSEAWTEVERLRTLDRGHPPKVYNYTSFKAWLNI